ncbi:MAG: hypothetical protein QM718_01520 [Steroidobacteraceae bacterium]
MKSVSMSWSVVAMAGLALAACSRQADTTAALAAQAAAVTAQDDAQKQAEEQAIDAAAARDPEASTPTDPASEVSASALPAAGPPAASGTAAAAGAAAQRVFVDPATGKARQPTDAEMAEAAARSSGRVSAQSAQAASETSTTTVLSNGVTEVHVGERGRHKLQMCRKPGGGFQECDEKDAAAIQKADAAGGKLEQVPAQ